MPKLIAAKAAVAETGIPYASLRRAAQQGKIPVVRMNRAWYFRRDDLEKLIASHTEKLA